ncbi:MAG TPA: tetratricopeptide repeat protein [Acidobacteriaceae bacterium]|nr:tetratricopeptide repeat protein [Acidobacteriaceae bacterium]
MGFLFNFVFTWWGLLLEILALVHFFRRRPDGWWLFIIIFLGPLGAIIYLVVEALPDTRELSGQSFRGFSRRKRIRELETLVQVNRAVGNFEELGDLYMDEGRLREARAAFDQSIALGSRTTDPFYRRGVCALFLGDAQAAIPDLERAVNDDPEYDFHRAAGLLAHACSLTGQKDKAEALFRQSLKLSTLSETYLNYADLLAREGRAAEAREWARKVLEKAPGMPGYQRRRERPWFRRARKILRSLPA